MTFELTILGCSSATPTPQRYSTAQVLNVLERFFLIDCGEGTQIQMRRFRIPFHKINTILISHLHGDHFLGIFGLLSSLNLLGRKHDLTIIGPHRLKEIIDIYISTLDRGLKFNVNFRPLTYSGLELVWEDDKLTIESFPLRHRIPTCGFIFKEKRRLLNLQKNIVNELNIPIKEIRKIREGANFIDTNGTVFLNKNLTIPPAQPRSYAFVSDTSKSLQIVKYIEGVDMLYHESTYIDIDRKKAKDTGHSTARQAAIIAKEANVKKLLLGHFSNRYKELNSFLAEAKDEFSESFLTYDGAKYSIPYK